MDGSKRIGLQMPFRMGVVAGLLAIAGCSAGAGTASVAGQPDGGQARAAAGNPDLDPGTSLGGLVAPGFRLVNQFGQPMSLRQFRGKVVILAFTDSECTTICPLTTASMAEAKDRCRLPSKGWAGSRLTLRSPAAAQ